MEIRKRKRELQQIAISHCRNLVLLTIFSLVIVSSARSQPDLSDNQYGFIDYFFNDLRKDKEYKLELALLNYHNIITKWEPESSVEEMIDLDFLKEYLVPFQGWDTLVCEKDFREIRTSIEQVKDVKSLGKQRLKLRKKNILLEKEQAEKQKTYPDFTTYQIAPPVFNYDQDLVLIYVENYCGMECGGGEFWLFKKNQDHSWAFLGRLPMWVS